MKDQKWSVYFAVFFSKYFQSSVILKMSMIESENTYQDLSDYNQFLLKKRFEVNKLTDFF